MVVAVTFSLLVALQNGAACRHVCVHMFTSLARCLQVMVVVTPSLLLSQLLTGFTSMMWFMCEGTAVYSQ